jgi:hypothetical protein
MNEMQQPLIELALLGLALLLGGTVYESVVMAPNYERDIPSSIDLARRFLQRTTPAHYFRVVAPVTLILLLVDVVVCWHLPAPRSWLLGGLIALIVADAITFAFHYPRLAVMFKAPIAEDAAALVRAARQWAAGNIVRAALLIVAFACVLHALTTVASSFNA